LSPDLWRHAGGHSATGPSLAGWWYALVSLPIFQFLLVRWLWRIVIWIQLLFRISRLDLQIHPAHPDRAGGLDFLPYGQTGFWPVVLALSTAGAGVAFKAVLTGAAPASFSLVRDVMLGFTVFALLLTVGPLFLFTPKMVYARRQARLEYGGLGQRYARAFDTKWIDTPAPDEELLGTSDIQSLADLGGAFARIQEMRVIPVDWRTMIPVMISAVLPFLPILLLTMPLEEILQRIVGVLT
jgi:hypothetical protein